jgi:hypothetical protein
MTPVCASHRWLRRALLSALAIPLIYSLTAAGTASAATTSPVRSTVTPAATKLGNFKVSYKDSWTFKSKNIGACVVFTATGNITYSVSYAANGKTQFRYTWSSQRLNQPTVEADIHAYANGSCIGPGLATGMELGQAWTGYSCSYNPSLSVAFPWSVGVSFWPTCGDRNQAEYHHRYSGTYTFYEQFNSGDPSSFGDYDSVIPIGGKPKPPCLGLYVYGTAYEKNVSDSYVSSPKQVCLTKY